jgi:RNA polymerase sigma factor (sigma-70 family)
MQFNFVENTYKAIEVKLKERNFNNTIPELKGDQTLLDYFASLKRLGLKTDSGYISYTLLDQETKTVVKEAAKCLSIYCAHTIHARFLKLGYDNYNHTLKKYSPIELEDKLKEQGLYMLADQLNKLRLSHAMIDQTKRIIGFKSHPFNINDEIVSAIFRADPVINRQAKLMLMTVYGFLFKKSLDLGRKIGVERAGVDQEDLFNAGTIGYLSAAVIWNPTWGKKGNKSGASFVSFGWEFASRYFRSTMIRSRIVRFPSHIEELIHKVHKTIRDRRIALLNSNQPLTYFAIERQLAEEFKTDIAKVREVFALFDSPSSALSTYLPSEQRLLRLDQKVNSYDTSSTLGDIIPSTGEDAKEDEIFGEQLMLNIHSTLKKLLPREKMVISLRFGLPFTPKDWQESGLKAMTSLPWHQVSVREHSLAEIGQMFDLTRERIRVIEAYALKKLRHPTQRTNLTQFMSVMDYKGVPNVVSIIQKGIDDEVPPKLSTRFSVLDSMDRLKFINLSGLDSHSMDIAVICNTIDTLMPFSSTFKYKTVQEVLQTTLELLYNRLIELGDIKDKKYNHFDKLVQALLQSKQDLSGKPTVTNSIGILLYYVDKTIIKHPIELNDHIPFSFSIRYLKQNPYFLINLV